GRRLRSRPLPVNRNGRRRTVARRSEGDRSRAARPPGAVRAGTAGGERRAEPEARGQRPEARLELQHLLNSSGRGGHLLDNSSGTPVVVTRGGLGDAFDQLGSLDFPGYGFNVQLRLPLRNHSAEADWGSALASQRRTLYQRRQREQAIVLEARN